MRIIRFRISGLGIYDARTIPRPFGSLLQIVVGFFTKLSDQRERAIRNRAVARIWLAAQPPCCRISLLSAFGVFPPSFGLCPLSMNPSHTQTMLFRSASDAPWGAVSACRYRV